MSGNVSELYILFFCSGGGIVNYFVLRFVKMKKYQLLVVTILSLHCIVRILSDFGVWEHIVEINLEHDREFYLLTYSLRNSSYGKGRE